MGAVIAALDWIVQHKASKNIKVLNLSLGVTAPGPYTKDILAAAVEAVWQAGIVVVVAAGNDGESAGSPITSPATDPYVIAVGALATQDTDVMTDDVIPAFSPRGSSARRVDLVAPGKSVVSLKSPGSFAATHYPNALIGDRYIKGTGTSQAAAVVSGLAADLLEARPTLTPDQVKAVLKASATPLPSVDAAAQGSGVVNLSRAIATAVPANATQTWPKANLTPSTAPSAPVIPPPPFNDGTYCIYDVNQGPPAPPSKPAPAQSS
jgi:serine protease AprX